MKEDYNKKAEARYHKNYFLGPSDLTRIQSYHMASELESWSMSYDWNKQGSLEGARDMMESNFNSTKLTLSKYKELLG